MAAKANVAKSEGDVTPFMVAVIEKYKRPLWDTILAQAVNPDADLAVKLVVNPADLEVLPCGITKLENRLRNNKSHKSLIKNHPHIVQIANGFGLRSVVDPIEITDDGLWTSNQNKGRAKPIKKARVASYEIVNRLNILYDQSKMSDSMVHALYIRNGVRDSIVAAVVKKPIAQGDREALDAAIHAEVAKYTPKAA